MITDRQLPEFVTRISRETDFSFSCHKGVSCFTDCCRMLELALTPYDVLRLRKGTGLSSRELLDQYILMEHDPGDPFPKFYLTMVDDGRASCVFITKNGCSLYEHRPSACRAYPLGRAVIRNRGGIEEFHVLMKEKHCRGFEENHKQTPVSYSREQGLLQYNRFNDAVASILQHDAVRNGYQPSQQQIELFILALYDLDTFRKQLFSGKPAWLDTMVQPQKTNENQTAAKHPSTLRFSDKIHANTLTAAEKNDLQDDEKLLLFSIEFLLKELYSS